eukprot:s528_g9.t1
MPCQPRRSHGGLARAFIFLLVGWACSPQVSLFALPKVTFPSESVPLEVEDIEALARASDDALALIPSTKTRACDAARLEAMALKLDAAMASFEGWATQCPVGAVRVA